MAVISDAHTRCFRRGLLVLLALAGILSRVWADETNAVAPPVNNDESFRGAMQLQEQLRQTQLAIEKNRREAEAQAASNASVFAERLDLMEKSLAAQRLNDISSLEESENRTLLIALSVFAGIILLVLIAASYFQWIALNRLASAAASMSLARTVPALSLDEGQFPPSPLMVQSGARFLEVIERLEQRITQFETPGKTSPAFPDPGPDNGAATGAPAKTRALEGAEASSRGDADKVSLLVGKSQTLMKMNKPAAALTALEEALSIDPNNAEVFIKKGTALERLHRVDEAMRCFDQSIAIDRSTTMAYLHKGALFNQMQRYNEALACYEQALQANEKSRPADLSVPSK